MNLETASALIPALKSLEGKKSVDGFIVRKFIITPKNEEKLREFLNLYELNKWNENGIIGDSYPSEDLKIIVEFDVSIPTFRWQELRDFLLKKQL